MFGYGNNLGIVPQAAVKLFEMVDENKDESIKF